MSMYWPILLVVLSNTFYNICAKATPQDVNPFASLSVTYLVGAAASLAVYFLTTGSPALLVHSSIAHGNFKRVLKSHKTQTLTRGKLSDSPLVSNVVIHPSSVHLMHRLK